MNKKIIKKIVLSSLICFVLAFVFSGCPASEVEVVRSTTPTTDTPNMARATTKSAAFTLTSSHPQNSVWRAFDAEFNGNHLVDVDVSYLRSVFSLTLIARGNELAPGTYWISVTEPAADESLRLGLTVLP